MAVTRAKRYLILNESLIKLLQRRCRESFEIPIPFREAKMKMGMPVSVSGVQLVCLKCCKNFALADFEFVFYRKPMAMTHRIGRIGQLGRGVFCRDCSTGKEPFVYQFNVELPDDANGQAQNSIAYLWTSYGIDYAGNPTNENDKLRMSYLSLLDPKWKDKQKQSE